MEFSTPSQEASPTVVTSEVATPEPIASDAGTGEAIAPAPSSAKPSYVKLAMRNMVRQGGKSLMHFGLTTIGLLGLLVGLAYLTR